MTLDSKETVYGPPSEHTPLFNWHRLIKGGGAVNRAPGLMMVSYFVTFTVKNIMNYSLLHISLSFTFFFFNNFSRNRKRGRYESNCIISIFLFFMYDFINKKKSKDENYTTRTITF